MKSMRFLYPFAAKKKKISAVFLSPDANELYINISPTRQSRRTCIICCASRVQHFEKAATGGVKLCRWTFLSVLRFSLMLPHIIRLVMQIPYYLLLLHESDKVDLHFSLREKCPENLQPTKALAGIFHAT